jgi:hypothetical protein
VSGGNATRPSRFATLDAAHDDVNAGLQASRGGPDPYDGVAELWFEDVDAIGAGSSKRVIRLSRR